MIETILHIQNGELKNQSSFRKSIAGLNGKYLQKITKANQRSLAQNAYYWKIIVPLVFDGLRNMGFDEVRYMDDAHEVLKSLFLKSQIVNHDTGELLVEKVGSTTKLSTVLFMDYIDSIIKWAAEYLNIQIPFPNEQMQIEY